MVLLFPLRTGESITPTYSLERSAFASLTTDSLVNNKFTSQSVNDGRVNEIQVGVILSQTNGTSPTLLGLTFGEDDLTSEAQL